MKLCRVCHSPLINKRSHAVTCSSKCRNVAWRQSRINMLPVTFMLNIANFALVKNAASAAGKTINEFAHNQTIKGTEIQQC